MRCQIYIGEIFPTRIREAATAIAMATQWLFNFVLSQITPHAVENLGWKTFVMFAVFNWALLVLVWFFVKETKGKSLEEMEARKYFQLQETYPECVLCLLTLFLPTQVFGGNTLPDHDPEAPKGDSQPLGQETVVPDTKN